MKKSMIRVATDVGGTFTDLVCFETDTETGKHSIVTAKTDTTPPDFEIGVLNVLAKGQVDPSEVDPVRKEIKRTQKHANLQSLWLGCQKA